MLYSTTLLVAAAALSGFASAQNSSTPDTVIPCCSVPVNQVPEDQRADWCAANSNTCVDLCGGQGQIASRGNECDDDTLDFTCKCQNGTEPDIGKYQQSVTAQMCNFWFGACINATGTNAAQQFQCEQAQKSQCGNLTIDESDSSSPSSTGGSRPTGSSGNNAPTGTGSNAASSSTGAAALMIANQYGTPALLGGMLAIFGLAL